MSAGEFAEWEAYTEVTGPIGYERRYDRPAALTAYVMQAVHGGKHKVADFLPYPLKKTHDDDPNVEQSLLAAFGFNPEEE